MAGRSPAQLLAWAVAAVLVALAGWKLLVPERGPGANAPPVRIDGGGEARADGRGGEVYVHVAGAVRRPGLYRLPSSARVAVALERAGGPTRAADVFGVNLAARVEDGQQVVVPRAGATAAGAASGAAGAAGGGGVAGAAKLSISTATVEQLDTLDGIGPKLAQRIVAYRDEHGSFRSIEELKQVEGIGDKRFESLREAVMP